MATNQKQLSARLLDRLRQKEQEPRFKQMEEGEFYHEAIKEIYDEDPAFFDPGSDCDQLVLLMAGRKPTRNIPDVAKLASGEADEIAKVVLGLNIEEVEENRVVEMVREFRHLGRERWLTLQEFRAREEKIEEEKAVRREERLKKSRLNR